MNTAIYTPIDFIHGDEHLGPDITDDEIADRIKKFWNPEDMREARDFLVVEVLDDIEAGQMLFDACRLVYKKSDAEAIQIAFEKLASRLVSNIAQHAGNDRLPITDSIPTLDDKFDDDCDSAVDFDDSLPFCADD